MPGYTGLKRLCGLSALGLSGCILVASNPPPPSNVVTTDPPPVQTYVDPQPAYQPPPPEVAPIYQDDLSPYGRWIEYPQYGRCWAPNFVPSGWRPYTVGHWVYTDAGWSWVSEGDEVAWGGIVYHYGQWAFTSDLGWIWVPGTQYAPAWVAWREGGGYCGWAPLPPEACAGNVSYQQADRYVQPAQYVYVNEENINVTRVDQRIVQNNVTVINKTTNITNITVVNNRVVNQGVSTQNVERATGRTVERVNVTEVSTPEEARKIGGSGAPARYNPPAIQRIHTQPAPRQVPVQVDHQPAIQPQHTAPATPRQVRPAEPQYAPNVHDGGQHPPAATPDKKPKPPKQKIPPGQDHPDPQQQPKE